MPILPKQDRWQLGPNRERRGDEWVEDGTAQLFKADKNGVLDFSLCVNFETAKDRKRAELMRRAPEMLAALQDVMTLWDEHGFGDDDDVSTPIYNRLKKLIAGV